MNASGLQILEFEKIDHVVLTVGGLDKILTMFVVV